MDFGHLVGSQGSRGLPGKKKASPRRAEPRGNSRAKKEQKAASKGRYSRAAVVFSVAAVVTLVAGVLLEQSGEAIARDVGMSGVLFGSTFLAAATALPEVSTGITLSEDGRLSAGGERYLRRQRLLASAVSVGEFALGRCVLPQAHDTDIYLTGLGILLTAVYVNGLIFRPGLASCTWGLTRWRC